MTAKSCFIFWVGNVRGIAAWLIRRVTGDGPFSHMGLGFVLEDNSIVYFEALFAKGFVGPRAYSSLAAFERDGRGHIVLGDTGLSPDLAEQKRLICETWVGRRGYAETQLIAMWLFERFGVPVPHSENHVVCSEAVSRILAPEIKLTDSTRKNHDEVTPNSTRLTWLRMAREKTN